MCIVTCIRVNYGLSVFVRIRTSTLRFRIVRVWAPYGPLRMPYGLVNTCMQTARAGPVRISKHPYLVHKNHKRLFKSTAIRCREIPCGAFESPYVAHMPVSRMGPDREARVGKLCCEFKTTVHGLSACSLVTGLKDTVRVPYRLRKVYMRAP